MEGAGCKTTGYGKCWSLRKDRVASWQWAWVHAASHAALHRRSWIFTRPIGDLREKSGEDATAVVDLRREWPETSPCKEELALLRKNQRTFAPVEQHGARGDQSGP